MQLLKDLQKVAPKDWALILHLIDIDGRIYRSSYREDSISIHFLFCFPDDKFRDMWKYAKTLGFFNPTELLEVVEWYTKGGRKRPSIFKNNSVTE